MAPLTKNKFFWSTAFISIASLLCIIAFEYFPHAKTANTTDSNIAEELITSEKVSVSNNINLNLVHKKEPEKGLLIYISNASSPQQTAVYAKKFAELSYYVAEIDSSSLQFLSTTQESICLNLSLTLANITQKLQTIYNIDSDTLPILVGDGNGATLVYAALAQAEKNSFHAGVSINFIPQTKTNTSFCTLKNVDGGTDATQLTLAPEKHLSANWYIFQNNEYSNNTSSNQFIAAISNAKLMLNKDIDIDPIDNAIQILQWLDPRLQDQISSNNSDSDLPLIEVTAENTPQLKPQTTMAVLLTGDGGWAEIDKNVANILAEKGIPTVALDSLSYFWRARTPEETAQDIDSVIIEYREKWQKHQVILIGYSFGADVLPFIANQLSSESKASIALIALLGMGKTASFEFRLSSWMDADTSSSRLPVLPELKSMQWANSICIYGMDDDESACLQAADAHTKAIGMSGDHHFDEQYELLVQHIIDNIKK